MLLALAAAGEARAAGLYVSDRGVRPLGRGGAFVAGAGDLGAIWYNPAGIVDTPSSVLTDFAWLNYSADYTRQVAATSATGTTFTQTVPLVTGTTPFLPIPTIAASYRWGERQEYAVAGGVFAPMAALSTWPETVTGADGVTQVPAPQRFMLISLKGSLLAEMGAWFVKGNPVQLPGINGGVYSVRANIIGGGLQYTF
jgi:long-chain fatty acid transport protein